MNHYKETLKTWNKVAKLYQDKFMDLDLYDDTYDLFCELISKINPSILEIGCGPGNITKYLLNKRPDFNIEAIDLSPNMIELAKINNPKANFKVMDCREISGIMAKFDAVISGFCLPYVSESECSKLIKDCSDLLADNGIIYFSFVEGDNINSGFQTGSSGDRVYFYYHSLDKVNKELNENKFKTVKLFHKQYIKKDGEEEKHTILITRKFI